MVVRLWKPGVLALLAGFGLLAASPAHADLDERARQRLYSTVKPAVVFDNLAIQARIVIQRDSGPLELRTQGGNGGSSWIISGDGSVITNGHAVEDDHEKNEEKLKARMLYKALEEGVFPGMEQQRGQALTPEEKLQLFQQLLPQAQIVLKKDLSVFLQNWKTYAAEVRAYSPPMSALPGKTSIPWDTWETGKDVAVLKIEGRDLPTVRIGDSDAMQIGADVHVAGYPGVVTGHTYRNPETAPEASFTRGQISSLKLDVKGSSVLQMDAAVTWGNSGGPVFNERGEAIGMATFISLHQGQQAIQGFNFAVPSNVVREFVRAAGVDTRPSLFDRAWSEALALYDAGKMKAAVGKRDDVQRLLPKLPDAVKLQREAMAASARTSGVPPVAGILGGALLLGIGVVAAVRVARGRARTGKAAGSATDRLIARAGPLAGNRFAIDAAGVRIGRDPVRCLVVLTEEVVSREHALVQAGHGGRVIEEPERDESHVCQRSGRSGDGDPARRRDQGRQHGTRLPAGTVREVPEMMSSIQGRMRLPAAVALAFLFAPLAVGAQIGAIGGSFGGRATGGDMYQSGPILVESAYTLHGGQLALGGYVIFGVLDEARTWWLEVPDGFGNVVDYARSHREDTVTSEQLLGAIFYGLTPELTLGLISYPFLNYDWEVTVEDRDPFYDFDPVRADTTFSGIGDLKLYGKMQFLRSFDGRARAAAFGTIQVGTGDDEVAIEGAIVSGGLVGSLRAERLTFHGQIGASVPTESDYSESFDFGGAVVLGAAPKLGLTAEMIGSVSGGDLYLDLAPGIRFEPARNLFLDAAFILNAASPEYAAFDYQFILGANLLFP